MAGAVGPEGSNHLAWRRPCMFYKLIVASILQDKKLKIPGKFAKKYGHDILSIVTLSVANGCSWLVETENVNGKLQFCNGWQEFLENHSIGDGYLLIFIYEGKSKFTVNIFDLAVSQIRHPCKALGSLQQSHDKQCLIPPEKDGLDIGYTRILGSDSLGLSPVSFRSSISDQYFSYSGPQSGDCGSNMEQLHQRQAAYKLGATFQSSRDVGTQVSDFELKGSMLVPGGAKERTKRQKQRGEPAVSEPEPPDIQKAEIKSLRSKIAPKASASRLRAVTAEGRTRVIHAAEDFKPNNPFFRIILRETHVYRRFSLRIPSDFARAYLSKVTGFIKLQASDGKQWLARCIHYNDVTILSKGWLTFARDNKLEEGDACIFELISSSSDVLLKVSIFRVQEEATPVVQPSKVNCFEFASKTGEGSSLTSDRVEGRSRSRKRRTEPEPPVIQEVEIESPCLNTASKAPIDGLETVTAEERKRAVHAAYAFKPDNPFFRVILRPTYVYRGFKLNVPVSFGLKYLSTATGFIKLQNSDGKQWSARFIRRDGQAVLSAGWRAFARDNKLEDGDVCVFVLMNTSDIVLEVKIFRVHEFVIPLDQSPEVDCVQLASTTTEGSSLISDGAKGGTRSKKQRTEPDKPQATQKAEMKLPCLEISSGMSLRRLRAVTTEGKIKAIHTAYAFKPDNPFFRVILRPTHVYRGFLLRIPASFSQRYLSSVGEFIKLQVSNGKQWPARCIKRNGIVALSKGWVAFARDNKLEEGDVCVFELISISDCVLNVAIFRVPEDAEPVAQPSKLDGFDVECTASEGREPVDEQQPSGQHEDKTEACFRFRQNAAARKITVAAEQRDRAVERAKAFQSINPFCQVVMRPSYLYDGCSLHLPSGFAKTHLSGVSGFIKLQSPEGKQWSVHSNCRRHVRARLSRGWYEFSLENNLKEGDVCVFELMESRDIVLMVTVFRVSESAGRLTDHLGQVKCELN